MKINLSKLFPSLALPLVVGFGSGLLSMGNTREYFELLSKPPLSPPPWVFGPVWTVLYLMIGLSLYTFWQSRAKAEAKKTGYLFFILQMVANFFWSLFFFGLENPLLGLINILLLDLLVIGNIYFFSRLSRPAAWLLIPYLLWICFASYLNLVIVLIN